MASPSSTRLAGKVCIVTGASSGIGRAIALALARAGAEYVLCVDLRPEPGRNAGNDAGGSSSGEEALATQDLITQRHGEGKAGFWKADVCVEEEVEEMVMAVVERMGRLDVMVNNAGIMPPWMPLHETPVELLDSVLSVNVRGTFLCTKHAVRQFLKQETPHEQPKRGAIINIASAAVLRELKLTGPYCASKAAVYSLTKTTALEYASARIQCNAICPGGVLTSMTAPMLPDQQMQDFLKRSVPWGDGGIGKPEAVANVAVWLASDEADWVTGIALPVDGGFSLHHV